MHREGGLQPNEEATPQLLGALGVNFRESQLLHQDLAVGLRHNGGHGAQPATRVPREVEVAGTWSS